MNRTTRRIPIQFLPCEPLAVKPTLAAELLSISRTSLWRLTQMGLIKKSEFGVYMVAELKRYAQSEARPA